MNIVETIQQELSGGLLDKLSSYTGQGEMKTRTAAAAALPALLSAFGSMASTSTGAEKLAAMARKFTPEEMASLSGMTTGQSAAMFDESKSALTGMLDGNALHGIVVLLQKFTGFDIDTVKKLLAFLTPVILGSLTKKFGTAGLTGSTVSALFAEQKDNIANAMPAGLSLSAIPGLPNADAVANAGSGGSMLLPILLVLALAAAGYWYFIIRPQPEPVKPAEVMNMAPEVSQFSSQLNDILRPLIGTLTQVKDAASAEIALPKLQEISGRFDGLKAAMTKVPETDKAKVKKMINDGNARLKEVADKVLALPGVSEMLKPTVDQLIGKMAALHG